MMNTECGGDWRRARYRVFVSYAAACSSFVHFLFMAIVPAAGQQVVRRDVDDWEMICRAEVAGSPRECLLTQTIAHAKDSSAWVNVSFRRKPILSEGKDTLRVTVPLGYDLDDPLELWIDGQQLPNVALRRCLKSGCFGNIEVDSDILKQLKVGSKLTVTMSLGSSTELDFPVSLAGFKQGLRLMGDQRAEKEKPDGAPAVPTPASVPSAAVDTLPVGNDNRPFHYFTASLGRVEIAGVEMFFVAPKPFTLKVRATAPALLAANSNSSPNDGAKFILVNGLFSSFVAVQPWNVDSLVGIALVPTAMKF